MADLEQLFAEIDAILARLISQQRDKIKEVALDILPDLAPEQVHDPHDYPEVTDDAMFNFEDGVLAGLMSARMALRTNVFEVYRPPAS
jgi:hypothetical protein